MVLFRLFWLSSPRLPACRRTESLSHLSHTQWIDPCLRSLLRPAGGGVTRQASGTFALCGEAREAPRERFCDRHDVYFYGRAAAEAIFRDVLLWSCVGRWNYAMYFYDPLFQL